MGRGAGEYSARFFRFVVWLLICAFFLPTPAMLAAAENPQNAHVLRRLNSPERARAVEEADRLDAAAREAWARSEAEQSAAAAAPSAADSEAALAQNTARNTDSSQPESMTEVLFNYAAGFVGVPGLAPRGVDGSFDEGLGFHQDGTARKAGGVTGSAGPSDRGQRSRAYIQSGLQSVYGMNGYAPGLYDEFHYNLRGRNDPTRGGRASAQSGYSRDLNDFDPLNMAIDKGLNWGSGFVNSLGEAAVSGLVDGGRARLNFRLDRDGYFSGEGDALLPFYDGKYTTIYTQLGARSMHDSEDTRWIGNFGVGQRWFPFAQGGDVNSADYDAGNLMLGYNAFFDYDFTRDHQRGGIGAEAQWDWLRLSSNYYFPLSSWRGSEDFDSRFVKERPAEGWDARVKAYLPFYRNVAITGAYSQWYGDNVGMFGADNLEKDPRVWSYGVEYTPVPLLSGFITQKSTERGRTDTEFGLNFIYHFRMPWEQQISHSRVAELRTVGGSRHEFVDRENRIILEYKAKSAYMVEFLGPNGSNVNEFVFRIRNGFDEFKAGQTVRVTASGVTLAEAPAPEKSFFAQAGGFILGLFSASTAHAEDFSRTYTSDGQGRFVVRVDSSFSGPVALHVQAGENAQSFTVNVVANTMSISTAGLPAATQNRAYSQALAVDGGTSPYTYAVTGGVLPPGMSLTAGGVLNGTPTVSGGFNFTVTVTDSTGATAYKALTLTVATDLSITTASPLPDATQNAGYASQTFAAAGGTSPYTYAVSGGALPAGMSLASGGVLSGIPTEPGTFSFTVTVTDSAGATASKAFSLTVDASTLSITTASPLPDATQNAAYASQTFAAAGGTGTYTSYAVSGGALPTGMSLAPGGVLSGTPTVSGTFSFTVKVTDSAGATASKAFILTVAAALSITTASPLPDATQNAAYASQTFAAAGGTGTYTSYAVSGGALPTNMSLTTGGVLSGTPTASGTFNFSVTVTDSAGATASKAFSLTVVAAGSPLSISTASPLPDATRNAAYAGQTFAASGGTGTYTSYTVSGGALPAGMSLASGGVLSGTPTESGTFNFTVTVTDSAGVTASKEFSLTVNAALTITTASPLPAATQNAAYAGQTLAASGGTGSYTSYAVSNGTLPVGMSLASGGVLSGTPTESGAFNFTVTVTDSAGATASKEFSLTVNAALSITTASPLPAATRNAAYASQTLAASGGTGSYTSYAVSGGTLPAGMSLAPGGVLSGTPTEPGTFSFTVTVTDSAGVTASKEFSLTVDAGVYTLEALPNSLTQHVPANVTFTVKQGGAPVPLGTSVQFTANSNFKNLPSTAPTTDSNGKITVDNLTVTASTNQSIEAVVDEQTVNVVITVTPATYSVIFQATEYGGDFSNHYGIDAVFKVRVLLNGADAPDGTRVTWSVASTDLTENKAVAPSNRSTFSGLRFGTTEITGTDTTLRRSTAGGLATVYLKDIIGERKVTVKASVSMADAPPASAISQEFTYGKGPLGAFDLGYPGTPDHEVNWATAISTCGGTLPSLTTDATYYSQTNLPDDASIQAISGSDYAAMRTAAGLPPTYVWSGRARDRTGSGDVGAYRVDLRAGDSIWNSATSTKMVLCVRRP